VERREVAGSATLTHQNNTDMLPAAVLDFKVKGQTVLGVQVVQGLIAT
jgi:hypothetical protein